MNDVVTRRNARRENRPFQSCLSNASSDIRAMNLAVEIEQEVDGCWIAEIPQISGALAYGVDRREAISRVEALALRVLADRQR